MKFPRFELEALGYHVETHGQKGFNGVAILSKQPLRRGQSRSSGRRCATNRPDSSRRVFSTGKGALRVVSLYLPNGNPIDTEKFPYKLALDGAAGTLGEERLALEEPLVLAGDYNVIPEPIDAKDPEAWVNDALFQPETRQAFRRLENLGFTDAVRASPMRGTSIHSGIIRPAPGRRTTAFASTT